MTSKTTQRAIHALTTIHHEHGSFRGVSKYLAEHGHKINSGLLSMIVNGERKPSRELLIALGIRKPPRPPMTEAEREMRKQAREITHALWDLHAAAHAGYTVSMERNTDTMTWLISIEHPAFPTIVTVEHSFVDAARRANNSRFAKYTNDQKED